MTKGYFQTWTWMSKLRRWGLPTLVLFLQFLCGLRGHEPSKTEWGYGGGEYADSWCRWCNKFLQVPKSSVWFRNREAKNLMSLVGKEIHED